MFIFFLAFLLVIFLFVRLVYLYFSGKQMTANDVMFQQRGVTVYYHNHTITIKNQTYRVDQVTGISTITHTSGRRNTYSVEIQVDDMRKPIHRIAVVGSRRSAEEFNSRICVALRKAGGPDFY